MQAQSDVTIHVTDAGTSLPIENAFVSFDNMFLETDAAGNVTFSDVVDGTYSYSVSFSCYDLSLGEVIVSGAPVLEDAALEPLTSNTVFFFIGEQFAVLDVLVELIGPDNYYSSFWTTDFFGGETINDVPFGEYTYILTKSCYTTVSGTILVDCNNGDGIAVFDQPVESNSNSVFFFVGELLAELDVNVELFDSNGFYSSFVTSDPFGAETIDDVPYGEYTYVLSKPCHTSVTGTVTVDCNNGDGIAVFDQPVQATSNSVFFFVGELLAELDVTVELFDSNGFYSSFVTSDPFGAETIDDVPYGEYTYVLSKPCHTTVTGTVTVDCNNGDGIAVFDQPVPATSNSVFFFIGELLAELDVTVELSNSDGYFSSFVTSDPFGAETIDDVPYGEYTYVLSKPCHTTVTGTVTVDCNNGDGIAVFDQPEPIVIDSTVSQDMSVLTANSSGLSYQWVDCDNGNAPINGAEAQSYTATANGNYAVMITEGNCTVTSDCIQVIISGLDDVDEIAFNAYPNPVQDILTIDFSGFEDSMQIHVYSIDGRLVLAENVTMTDQIRLDLSALNAGNYVLRLTNEGSRTSMPLIVR
jgi:hypothetical protein